MWYLAQIYTTSTTHTASSSIPAIVWVLYLAVLIVAIAATWKIFTKAGQAGWKSLIPIYNMVIMCRLVGWSGWYVLLMFIPLVNVFVLKFKHSIDTKSMFSCPKFTG
jgi:uncharacterized membrane protein YhaH (DUF805 family)